MPRRAPIVLSDNSDEDSHRPPQQLPLTSPSSFISSPSSRAGPRRPPSLSPPHHPPPDRLSHMSSPTSTLSWTSPRSAPSLSPPHSPLPHPFPFSLLPHPTTSPRSSLTALQRELDVDIRHLRLQHRQLLHPREAKVTPVSLAPTSSSPLLTAAVVADDYEVAEKRRSEAASGGGVWFALSSSGRGTETAEECVRRLLRDLEAVVHEAERWATLMHAANVPTCLSSS